MDIDFILDILSSNSNHAVSQYCSMIGVPVNKTDFKNEIAVPPQPLAIEVANPPLTWGELINKISQEQDIGLDQLLGKCRIRNIVAARRQLVFYALQNNLLTRQQLAEKLLVTPSRITQMYYQFASQENNSITKA
ncbi:MAG: hypothetical protein LLG02_16735 [Pelosinus sp.]|nr:hypothetical protein [Pelosinus sp.]